MKNYHFLFALLIFLGVQSLSAQTVPGSFNYQAVPRRQDSLLFDAGQTLRFRFQIREDGANGTLVFGETSNLTVNRQGAVNAAIGMGTALPGIPHDLFSLNWGMHNYFLSVSVDVNNNNNFEASENFGSTQLLSVPYAMFAAQAGNGGGTGTDSDDQTLSISGNTLSISSGNSVTLPSSLQTLSINGNQLSISQGNTVTLPSSGGGGGGTFTLPYNGSGNNSTGLFKITNNGTGSAIFGTTNGGAEAAVVGEDPTGGLAGVRGYSSSSYGVLGFSDTGIGVVGQSTSGKGVVANTSTAASTALEAVNSAGGKAARFDGEATFENAGGSSMTVSDRAQFNDGLYVGAVEIIADGGAYEFKFDGTLRPFLNNSDRLGSPSYRWSEVYATNGTINTSDATLKRDIQPLTYGIQEVMKLQPVSFHWIDGHPGQNRVMGFLAQDLQQVIPEVVRDREWVYETEDRSSGHWQPASKLGVAYSEIIPVAVSAIQEQQQLIETMRAEIDALKKEVDALKKH